MVFMKDKALKAFKVVDGEETNLEPLDNKFGLMREFANIFFFKR